MMTYAGVLERIAMADERVVVLTAENRAAIRNLPSVLGPRFIDVGIAEQTMVAAAAGLALRGRIPICHSLATFLTLRAFEFIRTDVGISGLPVKLVGGVPGVLSDGNGPTHQAIEDISLMRGIPGMQVFSPADEQELVEMMPAVVASSAPAYVRYNASPAAVAHTTPFEIGRAETFGDGRDVTLLTYGFLLREAEKARALLTSHGLGVRLLNMRSLKPVDREAIVSAARETRLLVTIEDHFQTGGLYTIVAETLLEHTISCPTLAIAFPERWFKPGKLDDVLEHEGLTGSHIAAKVRARLAR
jgi:transketolase